MILVLDNYTGEMKAYVHTKTYTQMFIAASFVITKNWTIPISTNSKWISELLYNHTVEYYSAVRGNKPSIYTTLINYQAIICMRLTRTRKSTYCIIILI